MTTRKFNQLLVSLGVTITLLANAYPQSARTVMVQSNTGVVVFPTNFWSANASAARTGLALTPNATNPVVQVTSGGSGATNAAGARTNLGLVWPGLTNTNASSFRSALGLPLAALTNTNNASFLAALGFGTTNPASFSELSLSDGTNTLTLSSSSATTRTNLGLAWFGLTNTTATGFRSALLPTYAGNGSRVLALNSNATDVEWVVVSATNTNPGIVLPLSLANGGTGATNVSGARSAILPNYFNNAGRVLAVNNTGTDVEWVNASGGSLALPLAVLNGGTGATNAATARTNLGLGATWLTNTVESSFRSAVGLGTANAVTFGSLDVTGAIDVINKGLTRTNLGVPSSFGSGSNSSIGGGLNNIAAGLFSIVGGGSNNLASNNYAIIVGGENNSATNYASIIVGGISNQARSSNTFVGGGTLNRAGAQSLIADHASVVGGYENWATAQNAFAGGGVSNKATASNSVVVGGVENVSQGFYGFVGGGNDNRSIGDYSAVVGGKSNRAWGDWSFVGGGDANVSSNFYSTIAGGIFNTANGDSSTVSGGYGNTASGAYSAVAGGEQNIASGTNSFVAGGQFNTASKAFSFAGGRRAKATNVGSFVFTDSQDTDFSSTTDNSFSARFSGGMFLDLGTNGISFANSTSAAITRSNLGISINATNDAIFGSLTLTNGASSATLRYNAANPQRLEIIILGEERARFTPTESMFSGNVVLNNQSTQNNGLLFVYRTNNEPFLGLANLIASNNTTVSNETLFRVGTAEATNKSAQFGFRVTRTNNGGEGLAVFSVYGYNALMMIGPSDRSRTNTNAGAPVEADIWTIDPTNRVMTLRDTNTGATVMHRPIGFNTNNSNVLTTAPSNTTVTNPTGWIQIYVGTNSVRVPYYQ